MSDDSDDDDGVNWEVKSASDESSDFGPDWDDVVIPAGLPSIPDKFTAYVQKPEFYESLNTFGKGRKSESLFKEDIYREKNSDAWTHTDKIGKLNGRLRIRDVFGKLDQTMPSPIEYGDYDYKALKRRPEAWRLGGKHKPIKNLADSPGPGAYTIKGSIRTQEAVYRVPAKNPLATEVVIDVSSLDPVGPAYYTPSIENTTKKAPNPKLEGKETAAKPRLRVGTKSVLLQSSQRAIHLKERDSAGPGHLVDAEKTVGPGQYLKSVVEDKGRNPSHTSRKDVLGTRYKHVDSDPYASNVGPGDYTIPREFGNPRYLITTKATTPSVITDKMTQSTAKHEALIPWPELASKEQKQKIISISLAAKYESPYNINVKERPQAGQTTEKSRAAVTTVQNYQNQFKVSASTLKS
jgi:hypothetical protein